MAAITNEIINIVAAKFTFDAIYIFPTENRMQVVVTRRTAEGDPISLPNDPASRSVETMIVDPDTGAANPALSKAMSEALAEIDVDLTGKSTGQLAGAFMNAVRNAVTDYAKTGNLIPADAVVDDLF